MRTFKDRINSISKLFSNFWTEQCCSYSNVFKSLYAHFYCGSTCCASHGNSISLLVKLRIKSVPSGSQNQTDKIKKLVLWYSHFPSKLIIIINVILDYVQRINYGNVRVQGSDVKGYHYFIIFNGNISDVVGKRCRIFGIAIFISSLRILAIYLLRLCSREPLYETIDRIETPSFCIFD